MESANGHIKQRRALSKVLPSSQIPFAGEYVRIICSLRIGFRPSLVTSLESDAVIDTLSQTYKCAVLLIPISPELSKHGP